MTPRRLRRSMSLERRRQGHSAAAAAHKTSSTPAWPSPPGCTGLRSSRLIPGTCGVWILASTYGRCEPALRRRDRLARRVGTNLVVELGDEGRHLALVVGEGEGEPELGVAGGA